VLVVCGLFGTQLNDISPSSLRSNINILHQRIFHYLTVYLCWDTASLDNNHKELYLRPESSIPPSVCTAPRLNQRIVVHFKKCYVYKHIHHQNQAGISLLLNNVKIENFVKVMLVVLDDVYSAIDISDQRYSFV